MHTNGTCKCLQGNTATARRRLQLRFDELFSEIEKLEAQDQKALVNLPELSTPMRVLRSKAVRKTQ